jgi:hypothetical protein
VRVIADVAHYANDLLNSWWIGWVEHPLVSGRTPGVEARKRRR